jgi:hypothetical protein
MSKVRIDEVAIISLEAADVTAMKSTMSCSNKNEYSFNSLNKIMKTNHSSGTTLAKDSHHSRRRRQARRNLGRRHPVGVVRELGVFRAFTISKVSLISGFQVFPGHSRLVNATAAKPMQHANTFGTANLCSPQKSAIVPNRFSLKSLPGEAAHEIGTDGSLCLGCDRALPIALQSR